MNYNKLIVEMTLDSFLNQVKAASKKHGRNLTVDELDAIAEIQKPILTKEFSIMKINNPKGQEVSEGYTVFQKAIIARIEPIIKTDSEDEEELYFSRKGLFGLFIAFDRMMGADKLMQIEESIKALIDDDSEDKDIYMSEDVQNVCDHFCNEILSFFHDVEKRKKWLRGVIESNVHLSNEAGDPKWECRMEVVNLLLKTLFERISQSNTHKSLKELVTI